MHGDARTYELVGGPMDGELRTLPAGDAELCLEAFERGAFATQFDRRAPRRAPIGCGGLPRRGVPVAPHRANGDRPHLARVAVMRVAEFLATLPPEKRAAGQAQADEALAQVQPVRRLIKSRRKDEVPSAELTAPITFAMPLPAIATNRQHGASRHFRAIEADKKDYWRACDVWRGEGRIPPKPPLPYRRAWLRVTLYVGGAMDDDNATARPKWAVDWLVKHRYLLSDRRTCLRWVGIPDQVVSRSHEYRLVLTLSPREP
jgi:hypothetical protein